MPTPTYDLIEEKVLGSAQASVTFSSIPGTYKDLVLEAIGTQSSGGLGYFDMRFNSDSGTNYSRTVLTGDSSGASSGRNTNLAQIYVGLGSTTIGMSRTQIMSYANTNVNKTALIRSDDKGPGDVTGAIAALWRSTAAITTISLTSAGANFASGCTFRLWGVAG